MAYVNRNSNGEITAVFETQQMNADEFIAFDNEELIEFLSKSSSNEDVKTVLSTSDASLIRVLEDLINTLIDKQVILFTDLPAIAQEKLSNREKIREQLNPDAGLLGEDEGLL
ncbi:MAG: hypothetical protein COA90_05945 [Gammaproteobacteria bacterium]|nr:MAG: hypothetical protein COA90_05945 [Gammaproteobacteria bacterium]